MLINCTFYKRAALEIQGIKLTYSVNIHFDLQYHSYDAYLYIFKSIF